MVSESGRLVVKVPPSDGDTVRPVDIAAEHFKSAKS